MALAKLQSPHCSPEAWNHGECIGKSSPTGLNSDGVKSYTQMVGICWDDDPGFLVGMMIISNIRQSKATWRTTLRMAPSSAIKNSVSFVSILIMSSGHL